MRTVCRPLKAVSYLKDKNRFPGPARIRVCMWPLSITPVLEWQRQPWHIIAILFIVHNVLRPDELGDYSKFIWPIK